MAPTEYVYVKNYVHPEQAIQIYDVCAMIYLSKVFAAGIAQV